eukprot:CAMPEP_0174843246 /NCGR_PEP_ID=MMETSP1114-20130205/10397_1 /TAXON_ID=312471 /ORGANISM="Neobodo designis, Strain CCAP 1951/1" /LENGTH=150 /DNA_ID=CAMNT_0016077461 /DNA_START=34 /DNA_END=484 /DNA_ORIENTATION=+
MADKSVAQARREQRRSAAEAEVLDRMKGRGQPIPGMSAEMQASVNRTADHHAVTMDAIQRASRISEQTNETGASTLVDLGRQRETLQHSVDTVEITLENLRQGRVTIRDIKRAMMKEKAIKALIIAALVVVIWLIIYLKWLGGIDKMIAA